MGRALTPRTNLDTLRKDAKRWLKALRAGDGAAKARLLAAWPTAPADPGLRDVQHAVALDHGCDNWIALKAAIADLAFARQSHAERVDQVLRHGWDGDARVARRILQRYPQVARDSIFTAATCGDLADVERRLAGDPDAAVSVGGSREWTALACVAYGRLDADNGLAIAVRLLDAGAGPNFQFNDGWDSPFKVLTGAIGLGEGAKPSHPQALELVELLIEHGADPYDLQALYNISIVGEDTHWYEALWRHCEARGRAETWRVVGETSLGGRFKVSTLNYLLGNAVGQNHMARAEWLLARGADPDTPDAYSGRPVLAVARLLGFLEMAALLERNGAEPAPLDGVQAFQAACLGLDEDRARALLDAAPELIHDPAPLLSAAEFGNAQAVALLLALGAPAGGLGHDGISPLHRAVQSGSPEALDALIAAGADVDLRERRWNGTPLSWAVVLGRPQAAERLAPISRDVRALANLALLERLKAVLDDGHQLANEVLPSEDAPTPLFCLPDDEDAAVAVARVLLAQGADPALRSGRGETPADAARRRGLEGAAELMEDGHGA